MLSLRNLFRFVISFLVFIVFFFSINAQNVSQTFTGSGTFTVPAGVTSITVECWGGGGAGGGGATNSLSPAGAGGGAGGAYARKVLPVVPGTNYTVTVGGAVTGTTGAGVAGNPSWFGTAGTVYAQGGAGGLAITNADAAGGTGSSASSIGDVVYAGGNGAAGTDASGGGGGGGGAGSGGPGGNATGTTAGTGTANGGGPGGTGAPTAEGNGGNGTGYGGGGGGGFCDDNSDHTGGNGAAGAVVVTYAMPVYYSQGNVSANTLTNWNTNRTGGGLSPVNFGAANQIFVVQSGDNVTANAAWNISGANVILRIEGGGTLTANAVITLAASGTLEVNNNGTFDQHVNSTNVFSGTEILGNTSTVIYSFAGDQAIASATYGNITTNGGGTKTIQGNITVNNVLNLNNGSISLGGSNYNITLSDGATVTAPAFNSTHMIICDGTGALIKQSSSLAGLQITYPIGNGTYYTPLSVSSITGSIAGTGEISIRTDGIVAPGPPPLNSTDLNRYWTLNSSGLSGFSANMSFTYNDADISGGNELVFEPAFYNGTWSAPAGSVTAATNTISITNASALTGQWSAKEPITTYYSYQSGDWGTANVWTTDPSGTLSANPAVPGAGDRVVILNGRTVSTAVARTVLSVQINEGGILDIAASTGHDFGDVRGQGLLRLNTNTFPGGTSFVDFVSSSGGTVEYYNLNNASISTTQLTYNNLIISNSTTAANTVFIANATSPVYTINGNFSLENKSSGSLLFRFGNPTVTSNNKINMTVYGDFTVNAGCTINVSNFTAAQAYNNIHNLTLYGDLTNNGTIRFTGLPSPVANAYYLLGNTQSGGVNYGAVKVTFSGLTNNTVTCNGTTDFYRFIVDKGTDQTYILEVNSSSVNNFGLYGPNNQGGNTFDGPPDGFGTGVYEKALFIYHGTLKLNVNINVPSITEGGQDFNIIPSACLWINGANVSTTVVGFNGTGYQAATLYGRLRVSAGSFSTGDAAGIVLGSSATPEIYVEGTGNFSASQVWSAGTGNKISYIQTGGITDIRGNGEVHAGYMLGLNNPNTVFTMTGGTLNFLNAVFTGTQGMDIRAAAGNYTVTGGTVNINLPGGVTFDINTTVPFWDLNLIRSGGAGTMTARFLNTSSTTVSVLNDLTVNANTLLNAGTNTVNLNIGHDFTLNTGSTYTCGNNITTFNGSAGQRFTNAGSVNGGTGLYNLVVTNSSNTDIYTNPLIIRNNLTIDAGCFLNDVGKIISVAGNITNSGTHTSQAGGGIMLNGTIAQTIGGSGNGIFGNLIINKTAGTASLAANQSMTGNLRLNNGLLDIGNYLISLGANSNIYDALYPATTSIFSATKMIRTGGSMSDGGVSKTYNTNATFVFPVGTGTDYTPAAIQIGNATAWGTVNVKPVSQFNPFVTSSAVALNYYWKVTETGFSNPTSVNHTYTYVAADVQGNELNYIPGVYRPFSWTYINDIGKVQANNILFENVDYISGDYTAGEIAAFQSVKVFYSRISGPWNDPNTWSSDSVGGDVDGALPGNNNPVVIGNGSNLDHYVTVPAGYNNITVGGLQISSGSTLDITTTTGHNFGSIPDTKIQGTGLLKISSGAANATFPGGDFGNFLSAGGGCVEYYNTGTQDFILPASKTYYNHLIVSPTAGRTITMPNIDLRIYGSDSIKGAATGSVYLNAAAARTLSIDGNLVISGGTLQFRNAFAQTINVARDIRISSGASFNVATTGTAVTNLMYISGNLNNSGTFDMYSTTRICNVYFTGNEDKGISGTGTNEFNLLYVNKGNSRNTLLNVTANNLTLSGTGTALILNNGTFRVSNAALNFTLSTATSFTIPSTAALSVYDGTVNIGTNNNAGDLLLAGRLELMNNGIVNIGNNSGTNNDIEYAPAGNPELIVAGGTLTVDGQIRRPIDNTLGSLMFNQSGGNIIVKGFNQQTTRAKFEILNPGSSFIMSGGTLLLVNGGGDVNYFGDVLITPESYDVTGGTVQIGRNNSTIHDFILNISSPVWNLTLNGTNNNRIADVRINPLTVLYDLVISGNSELHANGLAVTIGRRLYNYNSDASTGINIGGYQPGLASQITTFNGSAASSIYGSGANLTNFANLNINTTSSLTLAANSNIRVNSNLNILSGILNDGGNNITVIGNIYNSAFHTSPAATGGIIMAGTQNQKISGNGLGEFGNVNLNNALGVNMLDNSVMNGILTFTNGNLYIDDYMLTFGVSASISGVTDKNNMILMNGVISDQGVKKLYPAGAYDFTFPIGVPGKYTPVRYNVISNGTAGTILIRPVNYKHPATYENPAATNELQYYWYASSTGFSALNVNHEYQYINNDALPDETDYVVARYIPATFSWLLPAGSAVNAGSDNFTITGADYIDGEFTCGVNIMPSPNFQNMPIYYSRNATGGGNWTDPASWTLNSDGTGGPAPSYPQGNAVVILTGHIVTLNVNSQTAYSVNINGQLNVGTTLYHSLGHIRGSGTIQLTSTAAGSFVFPAGVYDEFMNNSSSTIDFYNNTAVEATLPLKPGNDYKPYQNVIFSGSGVKYMSAENMRVLGNLTINGGTLNNTLHNRNITILGNWTDNTTGATGAFVPGSGRVSFNGSSTNQVLTIANAATVERFYNFQINNSGGVTLAGDGKVNVEGFLYLTLGNINTNATNLMSMTNSSALAVAEKGSASFVNGPLQKRINAGSYFDFPVGNGNGTRYGNLYVSTVSVTGDYLAQYYNHNPGNDSYNPLSRVNPVDAVSNVEYWRLNGPVANGNVRVRWDSLSGIIPADASSRQKLRIVEWNGSAWTNRGNVVNDGGINSGTIQTSPVVSLSGNHYFTLGVESLPTATIVSGDSAICDNGSSTRIRINLTGSQPWTIRYRINGANETEITSIATATFDLVVSNAIPALDAGGPGNYVFTVSYIRDATGSTGIRDFTTSVTIRLNESPNPSISGNQTVAIGENNVLYSTLSIAGHTYSWTYAGTTGTTHNGVLTGNQLNMHWGTVAGAGWVRVTETVTTGGCSVTTPQYPVTITDIPAPNITGAATVCNNSTVRYRTARVGAHTYSWSLPSGGGVFVGPIDRDSVFVQWTSTGPFIVRVAETGGSTVTDDHSVVVNPVPSALNTVSDPAVCNGETANITVSGTAPGLTYQLYRELDNATIGAPVSSGPGGNITIVVSPATTSGNYYVVANNEYLCYSQLTDISSITVHALPVPTITGNDSTCEGNSIPYQTEAGMTNYVWTITAGSGTILPPDNVNEVTVTWSGIMGQYQDRIISVKYTDSNNCTATSPATQTIRIFRIPQTGPGFYIPNE